MDIEEYLNYKIYNELLPDRSMMRWFPKKDRLHNDTGGRPALLCLWNYDIDGGEQSCYVLDSLPTFIGFEDPSHDYYQRLDKTISLSNKIDMIDFLAIPNKNIYLNHSHEPIALDKDSFFWNDDVFNCKITGGKSHGQYKNSYGTFKCDTEQGDRLFLLHSERASSDVRKLKNIIKSQTVLPVYWFANGYVCATEHFAKYNLDIFNDFESRPIKYKFVCASRLFSENKKYRLELLNKIQLKDGAYSLLDICPTTGQTPNEVLPSNNVAPHSFDEHPNESAYIEMRYETPFNTSFLHVVLETLYKEQKHHLTEKIFKPIVLQQPFVLAAPTGCLGYLKSYGFRTFDQWWDESYDNIEDPDARLDAIADVVNNIASLSWDQLYQMRTEMTEVLKHNHKLFYGRFASDCWHELKQNLKQYDF